MSRTRPAVPPVRSQTRRGELGLQPSAPRLIAEWQQRGPETLSGYALHKLRLALAPSQSVITGGRLGGAMRGNHRSSRHAHWQSDKNRVGASPGVSKSTTGDEVFSKPDTSRDGAYAEYVVVRESEVALKPKSLYHVYAAAVPLAGITAWQALFDVAQLKREQRVLIHGGSGGVGHFAVQFAKWKGAHVIATASTKNQQLLQEIGVDLPIDYTIQRFEQVAENVDMVLDTIGGDMQERSWKVLKKGGLLAS